VADSWETAARHGCDDETIRRAVTGCAELAAQHCPPSLKGDVESFAELIASGSSPSAELRQAIETSGPLAVLEEEARA